MQHYLLDKCDKAITISVINSKIWLSKGQCLNMYDCINYSDEVKPSNLLAVRQAQVPAFEVRFNMVKSSTRPFHYFVPNNLST